MGLLQNGQWVDQWYDTQSSDGEFRRQDSGFRSWVTPDGAAGPTGSSGFKADRGATIYMCRWPAPGPIAP